MIIVIAMFLIGLTRYDLRLIRIEKQRRQHPYARVWRQRPRILLDEAHLSSEHIRILRKNYRSIENLTHYPHQTEDTLILTFRQNVTVTRASILCAIQQLILHPALTDIVVSPNLSMPHTVREFLVIYRMIVAEVLAKAAAGLNLRPYRSPLPVLSKRLDAQTPTRREIFWYDSTSVVRQTIAVALPGILGYAFYLATVPHQLDLLGLIVICFGGLLCLAIWANEQLPFIHKIAYTLLAPASLGYFALLSVARPLEMFADMAKAKVPVGVGLFVRIKNILRIV